MSTKSQDLWCSMNQLAKFKSPAAKWKAVIDLHSDDSSYFDIPQFQKKRMTDATTTQNIIHEVKEMRSELQSVLQITKYMKFPPASVLPGGLNEKFLSSG